MDESIFTKRHDDDCLPCRLVSGFGVLGIATYIYFQAKLRPRKGKYIMYAIALGTGSIGAARLLNLSTNGDMKTNKKIN